MTFTGLNSRNIYLNPIDNLKEYQASEKETCYEADKESDCETRVLLGDWFYRKIKLVMNTKSLK